MFEYKTTTINIEWRDIFAATALAGMLAHRIGPEQEMAVDAYAFADAMLVERAKKQEKPA